MTTIYTSKKTGVAYTLESTEIVDGKTKFTLYSEQEQDRVTTTESVMKRWYKKEIVVDFTTAEEKPDVEAEPEQEMLPTAEENTAEAEQEATTEETKEEKAMNKNQIKALENIHHGYNWVIGGLENSVQDGHLEEMPSGEELLQEVYDEVTSCTFDTGFCDTKNAPSCMKFAGKQFILNAIADLLRKDGYEVPEEIKVSKKAKKQSKHKAKTYEEQKWGLGHTRISVDAFCNLLDLSSVEYDEKSARIMLQIGADTVATRRAWENPITGSVWFRYKNYEYELTDMAYVSGVELETA